MTDSFLAIRKPDVAEVTIASRLETLAMKKAVDLGSEVVKTGSLSFLFQHGVNGYSEVESVCLRPSDHEVYDFPDRPTEEHSSRLVVFSPVFRNQLLWKPEGVRIGHFDKKGSTRRYLDENEMWNLAMSLENDDYPDVIDQIVRLTDMEKKILMLTKLWNTVRKQKMISPEEGWTQF